MSETIILHEINSQRGVFVEVKEAFWSIITELKDKGVDMKDRRRRGRGWLGLQSATYYCCKGSHACNLNLFCIRSPRELHCSTDPKRETGNWPSDTGCVVGK